MSYAIRKDGQGWRAVNGPDDVGPDEDYSETQPVLVPAPYIPASVSRRQGRLALLGVGKLATVESNIAAITDATQKMQAQIEYEADTWERRNAFLIETWYQLGGTDAELDALFIHADTL